MKKLLTLILSFCIMFTCIVPSQAKADSTKLKLNKSKATMEVDSTLKLKLGNLSGTKSVWTTSNKNVATVNKYGVVTAKKIGVAKINATYDDTTYSCRITVIDSNDDTGTKDYTNDVEITGEYTVNSNGKNYVIFTVKNNSNVPVFVSVQLNIKSNNGKKVIYGDGRVICLNAKYEKPIIFVLDDPYTIYEVTNFIVSTNKREYYANMDSDEKLAYSLENNDNEIRLTVKNISDDYVYVSYCNLLLFKDGQLVYFENKPFIIKDFKGINKNETVNLDFKPNIEYDSIKYFVTSK